MKSETQTLLVGIGVASALAGAKRVAMHVVQAPVRRPLEVRDEPMHELDARLRTIRDTSYAERLLRHAELQYQQHRAEEREARRLRRRGEATEAGTRLGAAQLDHARAVCELNRLLAPSLGGAWRQKLDQFRLDVWFERRRSRWMSVQRAAAGAESAANPSTLMHMLLWVVGGSHMGVPQELVEFQRQELRHYRRMRARARRYLSQGLETAARAELFHELAYHFQRSYGPTEQVDRW